VTKSFSATAFVLVELVMDRCSLTYGTAPCTAALSLSAACYKTFDTCQDRPNFDRTTTSLWFAPENAPPAIGRHAYRAIAKDGISFVVGEIDRKRGLGTRHLVTIKIRDFPDEDVAIDPHYRARPMVYPKTFWRKFLARQINYKGRPVKLWTGYLQSDGTIDEAAWGFQEYVIEDMVLKGGFLDLRAKDPIKRLSDTKLPAPTDGALAAAIGAADLSASVGSGQGEQYGSASFWVAIGEEILKVTSRTGDEFSVIERGQFGTTAEAHDAGSKVQKCYAEEGLRVYEAWIGLLSDSGIDGSQIDSSGAVEEDDFWLASDLRTFCYPQPTSAEELMVGLLQESDAYTWQDPETQLIRFRVNHPRLPTESAPAYDDVGNLLGGGNDLSRAWERQITRCTIFYGPKNWAKDLEDITNYQRVAQAIDADAESPNEVGRTIDLVIWARNVPATQSAAMEARAFRILSRSRTPPRHVAFRLEAKDGDSLALGAQADLTLDELVDFDGAPVRREFFVIKKARRRGSMITFDYIAEETKNDKRWGFYQENTAATAYGDASESQRRYAFYAAPTGKMPNGDEGYRYI